MWCGLKAYEHEESYVISVRRARARERQEYEPTGPRQNAIPAEKLDKLFDSGSDEIDKHVHWNKARRPGREVQRVMSISPSIC